MRRAAVIASLILSVLFSASAFAQVQTTVLSGTVIDQSGSAKSGMKLYVVRTLKDGVLVASPQTVATSGAGGAISLTVLRGSTIYLYSRDISRFSGRGPSGMPFAIPDTPTASIENLALLSSVMVEQGDTVTAGANGRPVRIAGNTSETPKFWRQVGSSGIAGLPTWAQPMITELGDVLITNPTNGQVIKYNSSIGKFTNQADATGGGGGGSLTVQEVDGSPAVSDVSVLQFAQSVGFVVTDQSGGTARVSLNAVPYSALALTGSILNADVNTSAAIAYSKLAALTASRLLVSDGSGFVSASSVTAAEAGYLSGVTSAIQTQLDGKLTGNQTITLSGDVSGSGSTSITTTIGAGTVTNSMLAGSIAISKLSITGTPDGSKFLRDDGTWQVPGGGGTVTSVGLSLPAIFTVSGSPVTGSGTLTGSLATQVANTVWAGPATGVDAAPTFRALVAADIPSHNQAWSTITSTPTTLSGYGITDAQGLDSDLTAIAALSADGLLRKTGGTWAMDSATYLTGNQTITLSGDVTGSGTTAITTTIGAGTVTNDMLAGSIAISKLSITGTPDGSKFLRDDGTWQVPGGGGTVTSVGLSLPAIFSVSGSPVTGSGTLTGSLATQVANTVWAGPATGADAAPTFRALVAADLPSHNQAWSTITSTPTTLSGYGITDAQGLDSDLTALAGLSSTGIIARTASATFTERTLTGTSNRITITNGDGVSGNPTFDIGSDVVTLTGSQTLTSKVLTAPDINGGTADALTSLGVRSTGTGAFDLVFANTENLTAGRTLTIAVGDADRTLTVGASASVSGSNTGDQTITLTGDVTGSGTGSFAATIANNAVTLGKMAQVATARFLGRTTAGTGDVESLTSAQATALLDAMVGDSGSGGTKGLVPAPASGDAAAGKFLKADGTWSALTTLDASNITQGTLDDVRLSSNVVIESQANTWTTGAQSFSSATSLVVPTSGGAAPTANGNIAYDSTSNVWKGGVNGATVELSLYDVGGSIISKPGVSQVVLRFIAPRAFTLLTGTISDGTNAPMKAGTSATAQRDFVLAKNGSTICTLRFAASGTQATYQTCTATDFAAGDVLTLTAPSTQDATLADIGFTFPGKLK